MRTCYMKTSTIFLLMILSTITSGQDSKQRGTKSPSNIMGVPTYAKFNINNLSTWIQNNGSTDVNVNGSSGFIFPKGSGRTAVYQSGFLWGGTVDGEVRVGGSTYYQGTVPGLIQANGTPINPFDPTVRIYRVKKNYKTSDMSNEIADGEGNDANAIRAQYDLDWQNWPWQQGAPFVDVNNDGKYDATIDIPGVKDADQTIWFVCNDFDSTKTKAMYGSRPFGLEEQVTVWGYKRNGALGNVLFRKFLLINKSPAKKTFTNMYASIFSDPDIGDAGNDGVGCDTSLSIGFAYNGSTADALYTPLPPPAVGFDFIQGPIVNGSEKDTAFFKGKIVTGKRNLGMTAFYFFINGDPNYGDPYHGNYSAGTLSFYNLMQGKNSNGLPFTIPNTNVATRYPLSGDPTTKSGWVDGVFKQFGDRRFGMASGPFQMMYGDTEEIVVAEIAAGAANGVDNLSAISLLKNYDVQIQTSYDSLFNVPKITNILGSKYDLPREYILSQNYPNPFNPTTKIKYSIPQETRHASSLLVSLKVYDVLGREVATLVNEEKQPGNYEVTFNTETRRGESLPSGVYFYRIAAGNFTQTKKLILLK